MKQLNIFKKATPLLLLTAMSTAMSPAMATDVTVPLNFTTLPVITITTVTGKDLNFGEVLSLTLADTCTMGTDDVGGTPLTPSDEGTDSEDGAIYTGGTESQALTGLLSGACTGGANGQVGIYDIASFKDADITVTVTQGTATDISFTPIGFVTNVVEGGTYTRETLAVGTDALVNASTQLTAYAQEGTNRAIVGGTITNFAPLTAGGTYATDFNLDVVYQ